jgi:hypothetical protein
MPRDEEKRHSDSVCALDIGTILLFEGYRAIYTHATLMSLQWAGFIVSLFNLTSHFVHSSSNS